MDIRGSGSILCPQCASSPAENACGHGCCAPKWSCCGDNEWSGRGKGVEEEYTTPRGDDVVVVVVVAEGCWAA